MDIKEIIANCPEGTRVSFLYPCIEGHSAETIVSLEELRALVATVDKMETVEE